MRVLWATVAWLLELLTANPNTTVFLVGLAVLAGSVAQWSAALAGGLVGLVLMVVGVWPALRVRKG